MTSEQQPPPSSEFAFHQTPPIKMAKMHPGLGSMGTPCNREPPSALETFHILPIHRTDNPTRVPRVCGLGGSIVCFGEPSGLSKPIQDLRLPVRSERQGGRHGWWTIRVNWVPAATLHLAVFSKQTASNTPIAHANGQAMIRPGQARIPAGSRTARPNHNDVREKSCHCTLEFAEGGGFWAYRAPVGVRP